MNNNECFICGKGKEYIVIKDSQGKKYALCENCYPGNIKNSLEMIKDKLSGLKK